MCGWKTIVCRPHDHGGIQGHTKHITSKGFITVHHYESNRSTGRHIRWPSPAVAELQNIYDYLKNMNLILGGRRPLKSASLPAH
jgi:hypothetical protein